MHTEHEPSTHGRQFFGSKAYTKDDWAFSKECRRRQLIVIMKPETLIGRPQNLRSPNCLDNSRISRGLFAEEGVVLSIPRIWVPFKLYPGGGQLKIDS